jgi:hypothetical protein
MSFPSPKCVKNINEVLSLWVDMLADLGVHSHGRLFWPIHTFLLFAKGAQSSFIISVNLASHYLQVNPIHKSKGDVDLICSNEEF